MQSYEKGFCHCQFVSVYVTLCHFMSLSDLLPLSRCKVTKRKFGTVTFCHYLSPFVTFQQIAFSRCKVTKKDFGTVRICPHLSAYVRKCPEMSAFVRISFTLQSYEKKNWHCPSMSSYVHLCPFMSSCGIASSRNLRCKVTKSKIGTVQICPIMSKFVHLILWQFHFPLILFGICAILH